MKKETRRAIDTLLALVRRYPGMQSTDYGEMMFPKSRTFRDASVSNMLDNLEKQGLIDIGNRPVEKGGSHDKPRARKALRRLP